MVHDYPDRRSLIIQFSDIERFDLDAADELLEEPDKVLKHAIEALKNIELPADVEFKTVHVRVASCPEKIRRRDIRQEYENKLITLTGVVQRITEVYPKIIIAAFKCVRCGQTTYIHQDNEKWVEPYQCENDLCRRKSGFKLISEESEKIDYQIVRLQELTEDLKGGEKSQNIDIHISDDIAGTLLPGNKVTVTGILRTVQRVKKLVKTSILDVYLEAHNIQINEGQESIRLTHEDAVRLRKLAEPGIIEKLIDSLAPTIEGMREIKEGLLCSLVSNGHKLRQDGTPQREFSHILVCTDPGMAKSNLKYAAKKIKPDLVLSSGTGATKVGLTAAAVKDDFAGGSWSIEVGALPLADMSACIIDEFDKMNDVDKNKMNDALSNCQFEINKAGFNIKLWTRCSVIAFCNPKKGRFDSYDNVTEQINLTPDTMSRFDLIFIIRDEVQEEKDRCIAEKMASAWLGNLEGNKEIIPLEDLQKYVALARTVQPELEKEVASAAVGQYLNTRKKSQDGRVAVTTRYLESIFRLAKAEAQLCLSDTIEMQHFERAVNLLEASIMQVGRDEKGNVDADIIATGTSKSQRDRMKLLRDIILNICNEKKIAALGEIILAGTDAGFGEEELEHLLEKMKNAGDLYELKTGFFKVV